MSGTKRNIVLALAVCSLLLPMTANAGKQVERPMKFKEAGTVIADMDPFHWLWLSDGTAMIPWRTEETGTGTHVGNWEGECIGATLVRFLPDGTPEWLAQWGAGEMTAANGDKCFFTLVWPEWPNFTQLTAAMTIDGGTGRFEGAGGSLTWVGEYTGEEWWEGALHFSVFNGSAEGTITY